MKKRQYTFLILLFILLYLAFKILSFEYKKYNISKYIEQQKSIISDIKQYLDTAGETVNYINTKAFKNKMLKEDGRKMKGEELIVLTTEKIYNKFSTKMTNNRYQKDIEKIEISEKKLIIKSMTNFEKWLYFLFKKDIR